MSARFFDVSHAFRDKQRIEMKLPTGLLLTLCQANNQKANPLGPVRYLVYHWTADSYAHVWDDYHVNFAFDKSSNQPLAIKTLQTSQDGEHIYHHNTGAYGLTFCAMGEGNYPVDPLQIEMGAKYGAEVCLKYDLDPNGEISTGGLTVPTHPVVTDHCWYAKEEAPPYFPDRWDIGDPKVWNKPSLMPVVHSKLLYYYHTAKTLIDAEVAKYSTDRKAVALGQAHAKYLEFNAIL